jgi:hypothetical protein
MDEVLEAQESVAGRGDNWLDGCRTVDFIDLFPVAPTATGSVEVKTELAQLGRSDPRRTLQV